MRWGCKPGNDSLRILDDDDASIWDTLLRYGAIPFGIRVLRPELYEEKAPRQRRQHVRPPPRSDDVRSREAELRVHVS